MLALGLRLRSNIGPALDELNRDLKSVGRLPRALSLVVTLVAALCAWAGWLASGSPMILYFVLIPLTGLVLSLRVRAKMVDGTLTVHSYLKTYVVHLCDVEYFNNLAYAGAWNRFSGTDSWLNLRMEMIDVTRVHGGGFSMPATMCFRRKCEDIATQLNWLLEDRGMN